MRARRPSVSARHAGNGRAGVNGWNRAQTRTPGPGDGGARPAPCYSRIGPSVTLIGNCPAGHFPDIVLTRARNIFSACPPAVWRDDQTRRVVAAVRARRSSASPRSSSTRRGPGSQNAHYEFGPYLSPFYSPLLFGPSPHAWFGGPAQPTWWPPFCLFGGRADSLGAGRLPLHLLLLPRRLLQGVLGRSARMRGRRAAQEVPGRALVPARHPEHPSLLPVRRGRLHRASWRTTRGRRCGFRRRIDCSCRRADEFGIGVGTLVLTLNVVFLGCYTFGCHSLRHLVGGVLDVMSGRPVRKTAYACSSCLNRWHMKWAWMSLVLGRLHRPLRPPVLDGHLARLVSDGSF